MTDKVLEVLFVVVMTLLLIAIVPLIVLMYVIMLKGLGIIP